MSMTHDPEIGVTPLQWQGTPEDGHLTMLDQRALPGRELTTDLTTHTQVAASIRDMVIRGAPAIGIAAAYGVFLGVRESVDDGRPALDRLEEILATLADTRPTAVNLFWALKRMQVAARSAAHLDGLDLVRKLHAEATQIYLDDIQNNRNMGAYGAELVPYNASILTHCNAGALATGGYGTAVGVIRAAHAQHKVKMTYADETRPYLQGARLTAWELHKDQIPVTLITDSMAGHFMQQGMVDMVVVGTDRTARNGDVANKIGTYNLAVLCKHHGIPFYVAAPLSTVDLETESGADIVIEERSAREVTHIGETVIAPEGIEVRHPAFDVTPAELVTAIITESGVARAPYEASLASLKL